MLTAGFLVPHPPAAIPAVGGSDTQKFAATLAALLELTLWLRQNPPDTLIVLSPHGEMPLSGFAVRVPHEPVFTADLAEFGAPEIGREYPRDRLLTAKIVEAAAGVGLPATPVTDPRLDFGAAVPLHFLAAGLPHLQLVALNVGLGGAASHAKLGEIIRTVADDSSQKIVLIASGELSHALTPTSPHGHCRTAAAWERQLVARLRTGDFAGVLADDPFARDEVAECGYRSLATLVGAFAGSGTACRVLAHEAPTGIGLLTAAFFTAK